MYKPPCPEASRVIWGSNRSRVRTPENDCKASLAEQRPSERMIKAINISQATVIYSLIHFLSVVILAVARSRSAWAMPFEANGRWPILVQVKIYRFQGRLNCYAPSSLILRQLNALYIYPEQFMT